jgi:RNA polymerase sigma-70 factor (ECF subfamily)
LIEHTKERFRRLTRRMLAGYPNLRGLEETDDVFQAAMFRLVRALKKVMPESKDHFLRLGAVQIRRELVDLARHHFGPKGAAARRRAGKQAGPPTSDSIASVVTGNQPPDDSGNGPSTLAEWTEFHNAVAALPEVLLAVVDPVLYQGLSQPEAAGELKVKLHTVKRSWRAAKRALAGRLPGGPAAEQIHE